MGKGKSPVVRVFCCRVGDPCHDDTRKSVTRWCRRCDHQVMVALDSMEITGAEFYCLECLKEEPSLAPVPLIRSAEYLKRNVDEGRSMA